MCLLIHLFFQRNAHVVAGIVQSKWRMLTWVPQPYEMGFILIATILQIKKLWHREIK